MVAFFTRFLRFLGLGAKPEVEGGPGWRPKIAWKISCRMGRISSSYVERCGGEVENELTVFKDKFAEASPGSG